MLYDSHPHFRGTLCRPEHTENVLPSHKTYVQHMPAHGRFGARKRTEGHAFSAIFGKRLTKQLNHVHGRRRCVSRKFALILMSIIMRREQGKECLKIPSFDVFSFRTKWVDFRVLNKGPNSDILNALLCACR